jgi:hypothetical protein
MRQHPSRPSRRLDLAGIGPSRPPRRRSMRRQRDCDMCGDKPKPVPAAHPSQAVGTEPERMRISVIVAATMSIPALLAASRLRAVW